MKKVLFYSEDIVEATWREQKKSQPNYTLGVVLKGCQDESSDSDSEDTDRSYEALRPNTVRVEWHPTGKVKIVDNKKVINNK